MALLTRMIPEIRCQVATRDADAPTMDSIAFRRDSRSYAVRLPRSSKRAVRGERGANMVEFALVVPFLMTVLFGIIEFGVILNNMGGMNQGVRDAARQAAVANYGTTTSCSLTSLSGSPSTDVQKLMCQTKSMIGAGNTVRVKVKYMDPTLTTNQPTTATAGNGIIVCAAYPITSFTGLFTPILSGKYLTAKSAFRIEQDPPSASEQDGGEAPPSGMPDWSWCVA